MIGPYFEEPILLALDSMTEYCVLMFLFMHPVSLLSYVLSGLTLDVVHRVFRVYREQLKGSVTDGVSPKIKELEWWFIALLSQ